MKKPTDSKFPHLKAPLKASTMALPPLRRGSPALPPTPLIEPKGERLNLTPLYDRIFVSSPDAGREEPGMIGGIHVDNAGSIGHAVLEVLSVGPDVNGISVGNKVLIPRGAVQLVAHDGQKYWWTSTPSVLGVIK